MKDIEIRNNKGKLHKENGPAYIEYFNNGNIRQEYYYINGKRHNENGPAIIYCFENGSVSSKIYFINDKRHNENGPAYIEYYENGNIKQEEYYINGTDVTKTLTKWHKQNNIPLNNLTSKQKILRKIQIGI